MNDKTINYIIAIAMPLILAIGSLIYSRAAEIQTRLRNVELYVSRIGVKVGLSPLQAISLTAQPGPPVLARADNNPLGDTE